ncbi:MAG: L,D-transpeptidase family protein [Akkermansia sp.]|nr:L,D-transpeptidase family protein [Akkermansia sp.]
MKKHRFLTSLGLTLTALLSACQNALPPTPVPNAPVELTKYEKFITNGYYPEVMDIYLDEELLPQANSSCPIYICLSQQRGRLYVGDQVAADWPVSTGIPGRETPTGKFRITQKKEQYASNRYGKMYDANGKCIDSDADAFKDPVPPGGKFVGSPMPNWQRLTSDGVGMHTGKVRAGQRLSHGCIRTPNSMAVRLFGITAVGTRVTVSEQPEAQYPSGEKLQQKLYENKIARARNKSANAVYQANIARMAQD